MSDYKKTLRLPQTSFPMKASLTANEPKTLALWEEIDAYGQMVRASGEDAPRYVLHDGPPYANGHIHLGTALNKTLKDIIVKHKNMSGYRAEYVPGWDCHGLPIELKVEQQIKEKEKKSKEEMSIIEVRRRCREYAASFVDVQRAEFKRLGGFGAWDKPYLTMNPEYEAATAGELGKFIERGGVVRGKKPIHWCASCETALAEAEVEYANHTSWSVYVRFPLTDARLKEIVPQADPARAFICIWTTTPWTLPANMAVAVHPDFDYVLVEVGGAQYVLAEELLGNCKHLFKWEELCVLATFKGAALEGVQARHPFLDRVSPVVLADYVTLDTGTGCVHTAPGHGREDYETGLRYGLEVLSPLDDKGRFLPDTEHFAGLSVFKANPEVVRVLKEQGNLLAEETITHSYPHCWRCKKPVIFRATTQWFVSMEKNGLRDKALKAIDDEVRWIPSWGHDRIYNMIANRPDWCISRQRMWGVPIIALICKRCDEAYMEPAWVKSIVERFAKHERGCDYWFEADISDIVPAGLKCPKCGGDHFEREDDILDVWFDSGTSYAAVLEKRPECRFPADLYLEGSDQHRGWFHSSLLASVGTRDQAPYKSVLTHGYVVDGQGRKMSKSVGNVVAPQEIINKHGAEILRLWTASVDYREDIRVSDEILSRLVDAYRRIRNTCRFILGNLHDFEPARDAVADADLLPLDRYALDLVYQEHRRIQEAYEEFEFHKVSHTLHNLCVTDLSAFYLDILKDRLYVTGADSRPRRSAQTVLWRALGWLMRDMAPILSFTAEEVYRHLPQGMKGAEPTVFCLRAVDEPGRILSDEEAALWEKIVETRAETTKAIEPLRKAGTVGHSLDVHARLFLADDVLDSLRRTKDLDLREIFIVSQVTLAPLSEAPADACAVEAGPLQGALKIVVKRAPGDKCERCWVYSEELGSAEEHPMLCPRCSDVMERDYKDFGQEPRE